MLKNNTSNNNFTKSKYGKVKVLMMIIILNYRNVNNCYNISTAIWLKANQQTEEIIKLIIIMTKMIKIHHYLAPPECGVNIYDDLTSQKSGKPYCVDYIQDWKFTLSF